jgi:hypothetical protein
MKGLLLLWLVASVASQPPPTLLRVHTNNYGGMSSNQAMDASISQLYPDLANRYIQTAFSVDASQDPVSFLSTLEAVSVDFMLGQRPVPPVGTAPGPYDFTVLTPAMLGSTLQFKIFFYDDANNQPPCYLCPNNILPLDANATRSFVLMDAAANATSITTVATQSWATIYRLSVLLLNRSGSISFCNASATSACALMRTGLIPASFFSNILVKTPRLWVVIMAVLPNQNNAQKVQYTFRLPVSNDAKSALSLQLNDPFHMINNSWLTWQNGAAIASVAYPDYMNPQVALQAAGFVSTLSLPSLLPPSPPNSLMNMSNNSSRSSANPSSATSPTIRPSVATVVATIQPLSNTTNGTNGTSPLQQPPKNNGMSGGTLAWVIAGSVVIGLIVLLVLLSIALIVRRAIRQRQLRGRRGGLIGGRDLTDMDGASWFSGEEQTFGQSELRLTSLAQPVMTLPGQPVPAYQMPDWLGQAGTQISEFFTVLMSGNPYNPAPPKDVTELAEGRIELSEEDEQEVLRSPDPAPPGHVPPPPPPPPTELTELDS